jgi:hypothetical protein
MKNDPYVAEPFGAAGNLGRRLREIFGEAHGDVDDRMIELLHQLDFIPSHKSMKSEVRWMSGPNA